MRRIAISALLALYLFSTVGVTAVGADPVRNPNAVVFPVSCTNGETVQLTGTERSAVALVVDDTRVTILYQLTVTEIATGRVLFALAPRGEKAGLEGDLVTCVSEDGGVRTTAVVFFTPRGR